VPNHHSTLFSRRQIIASAIALPVASAGSLPLWAQTRFPERPVTIIVPFAAAGIADLTARALAGQMARKLGQPVIVDNRPGAGGISAGQAVATARPDGHTLLLMSNANAVSVGLFRRLPFDTVRDFAPVSTIGFFDLGIFVSAGSRFARLADVVSYARANPGRLNVGTIAIGSTQHLSAKLFETVAGVEFNVVPYRGSPAALTALRSGEVDVVFEILGPMIPHITANVTRPLAVTSSSRNQALPNVPTVTESGVLGYDVSSWNALAAPAGTPQPIIEQLNQVVRDSLAMPQVRDQLVGLGMRLAPSTPAELQALLGAEIRRWGEVIRVAKIEPE